jgi:hypothetical protein
MQKHNHGFLLAFFTLVLLYLFPWSFAVADDGGVDDLIVMTVGEYKQYLSGPAANCKKMSRTLMKRLNLAKATRNYTIPHPTLKPLSDEEITRLIGEFKNGKYYGFAIGGPHNHFGLSAFYARKTKMMLTIDEMFGENAWEKLAHTTEFDDFPVVCAAKDSSHEEKSIRDKVRKQNPERYQELRRKGLVSVCEEKSGPFCELSGGEVLNAIYRNDIARVAHLEGGRKDVFNLAVYYMYSYQNFPQQCLNTGSRQIKKTYTIEETRFETLSGLDAGALPESKVSAYYFVNPEFIPLCERICKSNVKFLPTALRTISSKDVSNAITGIDQITKKYDCNNPDVKQFERNLISITDQQVKQLK